MLTLQMIASALIVLSLFFIYISNQSILQESSARSLMDDLSGTTNDIELKPIDTPFSSQLHLSLPKPICWFYDII